jgi:hypothetical protein
MTTPAEQTAVAWDFAAFWQGKGYEKGQTQPFWLDLLRLLGVDNPSAFIEFEDAARMDEAHGFIDAFIPSTHVLVEQKSLGRDLRAPIRQFDGTLLTPFQQARRYSASLPYSQRPRWIVTCNFAEFHVYDMENPNAEPETIRLADLPDDLYRLRFLVNAASDRVAREMEVSIEAGRIVGRIYDALLAQYGDPTPEVLHWLNVLCVRLVFCLYAEDAGIFADDQFHDYLAEIPTADLRDAFLKIFEVLDTQCEKRSPYLKSALAAFPYVNGSLFSGSVEIPQFTEELRAALLEKASLGFDWSEISPTIFGAVFESTLNPETRRSGGMHYTSIENIHKVIDPLFLDALRAELDSALALPVPRQRDSALLAYQQKLASLTFLDPACGSGNFLTETYLSLRRLENRAIAARHKGQGVLGLVENPIRVSIQQFHGIEINDFAVSVAKTALWIAESQMLAETAQIVRLPLDFLPLESYDGIVEGNALRLDWGELNSRGGAETRRNFDYIMGNPPFRGARRQSPEQKADLVAVFGPDWKGLGTLDYVSGWYKKAADFMAAHSATHTAFVSVNSITQGEQVAPLWKPLVADGLAIDFAHRSFVWDSESTEIAHVHCVIIGFSSGGAGGSPAGLPLYDGDRHTIVPHINPYLVPAPDIFVDPSNRALSADLPLVFGSMPNDGGHLSGWSPERRAEVLAKWPQAEPLFRRMVGADEFLNGIKRWCLWLPNAAPSLLRAIPPVMEAINATRDHRIASNRAATRRLAETPALFGEIRQPASGNYLLIPRHSSENRRYIPLGFLDHTTICGDSNLMVPNATLYHFGILTSNVHMAWMRAVAGRLEERYRYSAKIVYNTFPWPDLRASATPREKIETTARAILDARAAHPGATLADLYDPLTMPPDLLDAHRANDRAVMTAYGFDLKMSESDCVAELFKLYQALTAQTQETP